MKNFFKKCGSYLVNLIVIILTLAFICSLLTILVIGKPIFIIEISLLTLIISIGILASDIKYPKLPNTKKERKPHKKVNITKKEIINSIKKLDGKKARNRSGV